MKQIYMIVIMAVLPLIASAQSEYYSTDSTSAFGIKLVDGGDLKNAQFCQVKHDDEIITYTPDEVKEYGFKDGRVYISMEIPLADTIQRVFLQQLVKGETTLYYYRGKGQKTFFIERDSILLVELPRRSESGQKFTELLANYSTTCQAMADVYPLVSYNQASLTKFYERYNLCEHKPFPHFRYGVLVGYESSKLLLEGGEDGFLINPEIPESEYLNQFDFTYNGSFSFGVFIDQPIVASDFSVHAELLYAKHGYSYNTMVAGKDLDFVANFTSLKLPLLLRYAYPSNKVRPFINAGLAAAYYIKNETFLFEAVMTDGSISISEVNKKYQLNDYQLGYAVGGGAEYKLNAKRSLFFELRYSSLYNPGESAFKGSGSFNVLTGINF